jgi:ribosomal protein L40E
VHRASARVAFTVLAGGTTWLNLTIVRIEEVMGHVNSTAGGPVAGAVLQFSLGGSVRGGATTDTSGAFRTSIDAGSYNLTVTKAGFGQVVRAVTVGAGQVVALDLSMEPTDGGGNYTEFPTFAAIIILFVMFMLFGSFYYVGLQSRRIRMAAAETEARRRAAGSMCPECGTDLAPGATKCPRCGFVLQVRCSDCGRLVDLKGAATGECPECGAMLK